MWCVFQNDVAVVTADLSMTLTIAKSASLSRLLKIIVEYPNNSQFLNEYLVTP